MKTTPDQNRDDALLDALLGGEPWAEVNAAVKRAALAEFHARQRRRLLRFWAMQAAACAIFAGGIFWLTPRAAPPGPPKTVAMVAPAKTSSLEKTQIPTKENPSNGSPVAPQVSPEQNSATTMASPSSAAADLANRPEYISEEQMLALFPKGSCIIAEIDGQTQLIFFDHKIEEEGAPYQPGS